MLTVFTRPTTSRKRANSGRAASTKTYLSVKSRFICSIWSANIAGSGSWYLDHHFRPYWSHRQAHIGLVARGPGAIHNHKFPGLDLPSDLTASHGFRIG